MRYIEVDGLRVSRIGLGTWQFGSREWGYGEQYANETAPALLRTTWRNFYTPDRRDVIAGFRTCAP